MAARGLAMKSGNVDGAWQGFLWGADTRLDPSAMLTASEQMFFRGSPLAHVVCYEEELLRDRRQTSAHISQARRLHA
jgi:hypothetical protein